MFWSIFWAAVGAMSQFVTSWIGWDVTKPKSGIRRHVARWVFVIAGIFGVVSVAIVTKLSGRTERAHFDKILFPTVSGGNPFAFAQPNRELAFNVGFKNVGNGNAVNAIVFARTSLQEDMSAASENEAIADFRRHFATFPGAPRLMTKDHQGFFTAHGPALSPEDAANILASRRVVYVVGAIEWTDFGKHAQRLCQYVQPPQVSPNPLVFATCSKWNDEVSR